MARTARPFTLGISGPPGAGKSSLLRALAGRVSSLTVDYDRYRPLTRLPLPDLRLWFARGGDPNEIDHSDLVAELERATAPRSDGPSLVLFETPFGRWHKRTGAYIDFLVWIDTPLDLALSRAMLAFTQSAQRTPSGADFLNWQVHYLENYPFLREMYASQSERVRPAADLVLDGAVAPGDWIRTLDAERILSRALRTGSSR